MKRDWIACSKVVNQFRFNIHHIWRILRGLFIGKECLYLYNYKACAILHPTIDIDMIRHRKKKSNKIGMLIIDFMICIFKYV